SDEDAEAYLIGSNQLTALGGWDDHGLADILTDLADAQLLELTGHTGDDLDQLVASLSEQQPPQAGHTDPDDVPDPPAVPVTKPGDLWQLGPHRVLCGDATNPDHLELVTAGTTPAIIYADPPYGLDIVTKAGKVGDTIGYPMG